MAQKDSYNNETKLTTVIALLVVFFAGLVLSLDLDEPNYERLSPRVYPLIYIEEYNQGADLNANVQQSESENLDLKEVEI